MDKAEREKLREMALAAYRLEWESYDANEGLFPPHPLWCVANDAYHNPNEYLEDGISFAAQIECGYKEDADFIVAAQPKNILALLDHIDALELTEKRMDKIMLMYQVQMQQIWLAALEKNTEKIKQLVHESLNSAIDSAQGVKK